MCIEKLQKYKYVNHTICRWTISSFAKIHFIMIHYHKDSWCKVTTRCGLENKWCALAMQMVDP